MTCMLQLNLTSHVSNEDFQLGYSMTGVVERSFEKYMSFQTTHLAFVKRKDVEFPPQDQQPSQPPKAKNSSSKAARIVKGLCRIYLSNK